MTRSTGDTTMVHEVRTPAGERAWLVDSDAQVRELLCDARLVRTRPSAQLQWGVVGAADEWPDNDSGRPDQMHVRQRNLLIPHLTERRMRDMSPAVQLIVDDGLKRFIEGGAPASLRTGFVRPVVTSVICELLGVPAEEHTIVAELLARKDCVTALPEHDALDGYFRQLAACKRAALTQDVISGIAATARSDAETSLLAQFLLFAGVGIVVKQLVHGFTLLQTDPERRARIAADPASAASLVTLARKVIARPSLPRWAREDMQIGGARVARHELVLLDVTGSPGSVEPAAGGHATLDLAPITDRYLVFAYGMWACLCKPLAQEMLRTLLTALITGLPSMRLVPPPAQRPLVNDPLGGGLAEDLIVTW